MVWCSIVKESARVMLPSLGLLPIGVQEHDPFQKNLMNVLARRELVRRAAQEATPKPDNEDDDKNKFAMDESDKWRQRELKKIRRRIREVRANDPKQPTRRTIDWGKPGALVDWQHDDDVPTNWEDHADELADGALVNVFANTHGVDEAAVPVNAVQTIVHDTTGQSTTYLARAVDAISNTYRGTTLDWSTFRALLEEAVDASLGHPMMYVRAVASAPRQATLGLAVWIVGAMYSYYLLKEEAAEEAERQYQSAWWAAATDSRNPSNFGTPYAGHNVARNKKIGVGAKGLIN